MSACSNDEYQEARAELEVAVRKFFSTVDPDEYLNTWLLVGHKMSAELEAQGMSSLGMHGSRDLHFVARRGMLEEALDTVRGTPIRISPSE